MKTIIKIFYSLLLLMVTNTFSYCLSDRLKSGENGDFIITFQNNIYTLLSLQEKKDDLVDLAEINFSKNKVSSYINKKDFSWKNFILENETNKSSYLSYNLYRIDLRSNKFIIGYNVKNENFFTLSKNENFFTTLLNIPLEKLSKEERKKIGPAPMHGEVDRRAIWSPPQIINGKKIKNSSFDVYQGLWPNDGSDLSNKYIDLYFDQTSAFAFPYWIQVNAGYLDVMLKIIDSGKKLTLNKKIEIN